MRHYRKFSTASDIYSRIVYSENLKDFTVIIVGKSGPTGKSTLCRLLINAGMRAIDISESINNYVDYTIRNAQNDMIVDEENKIILVVLNRRISNNE